MLDGPHRCVPDTFMNPSAVSADQPLTHLLYPRALHHLRSSSYTTRAVRDCCCSLPTEDTDHQRLCPSSGTPPLKSAILFFDDFSNACSPSRTWLLLSSPAILPHPSTSVGPTQVVNRPISTSTATLQLPTSTTRPQHPVRSTCSLPRALRRSRPPPNATHVLRDLCCSQRSRTRPVETTARPSHPQGLFPHPSHVSSPTPSIARDSRPP
jgi:hypothetical protein